MGEDRIYVNDIGTIFIMTITENGAPVDISSATTKEFHFDKPNANGKFSKDAVFAGIIFAITTFEFV